MSATTIAIRRHVWVYYPEARASFCRHCCFMLTGPGVGDCIERQVPAFMAGPHWQEHEEAIERGRVARSPVTF